MYAGREACVVTVTAYVGLQLLVMWNHNRFLAFGFTPFPLARSRSPSKDEHPHPIHPHPHLDPAPNPNPTLNQSASHLTLTLTLTPTLPSSSSICHFENTFSYSPLAKIVTLFTFLSFALGCSAQVRATTYAIYYGKHATTYIIHYGVRPITYIIYYGKALLLPARLGPMYPSSISIYRTPWP